MKLTPKEKDNVLKQLAEILKKGEIKPTTNRNLPVAI